MSYETETQSTEQTEVCAQLGGVAIAARVRRSILSVSEVSRDLLARSTSTIEEIVAIQARREAAAIFADCFGDFACVTEKYMWQPFDRNSPEDWFQFGKSLNSDLFEMYRTYADLPENRVRLDEAFSVSDSRFKKIKTRAQRWPSSGNQKRYQSALDDRIIGLFESGIHEGVQTALAYYEVGFQLGQTGRNNLDYPAGMLRPIRQLIGFHAGVDYRTNGLLLSQMRRTEGDSYDNLLFDPEVFRMKLDYKGVELSIIPDMIDVPEKEYGSVVGCPAFGRGTIARLCGEIEKVVTSKSYRSDLAEAVVSEGFLDYTYSQPKTTVAAQA